MLSSNAVAEASQTLESLAINPTRVNFSFVVDHSMLDKQVGWLAVYVLYLFVICSRESLRIYYFSSLKLSISN
jgi:hypothetical protein